MADNNGGGSGRISTLRVSLGVAIGVVAGLVIFVIIVVLAYRGTFGGKKTQVEINVATPQKRRDASE